MKKTYSEKVEQLQSLVHTLRVCTQPVDGHDDPNSVDDCWNWLDEILTDLRDQADKLDLLLPRAQQFEKEWADISELRPESDIVKARLNGIAQITRLIERHV